MCCCTCSGSSHNLLMYLCALLVISDDVDVVPGVQGAGGDWRGRERSGELVPVAMCPPAWHAVSQSQAGGWLPCKRCHPRRIVKLLAAPCCLLLPLSSRKSRAGPGSHLHTCCSAALPPPCTPIPALAWQAHLCLCLLLPPAVGSLGTAALQHAGTLSSTHQGNSLPLPLSPPQVHPPHAGRPRLAGMLCK